MPDEPDKPVDEADDEGHSLYDSDPNDRPTVSPPFDPVAFARDILKPSPAPMPAVGPKSDLHTHATPPLGTAEQAAAAKASRPSSSAGVRRRKTPTSTLSLANARIPSNLPPRPGSGRDERPTEPGANAERSDFEVATRPPPADGPSEDPVVEISQDRSSQLGFDEVDLESAVRRDARSGSSQAPSDEEHAADTVRRPLPQPGIVEPPPKPSAREMNDRMSLGDYSGALEIAEKLLADTPDDIGAKTCAETCRTVLRQMYATRIGPLERVPIVMVPRDQLRWLSIDHKAGFVLSLVDGVSSLEMIIDVSGMPELDTLRILSELAQQRIISLR